MKSSQKQPKDGKPKAAKKYLSAALAKIRKWEAKHHPLPPCPVCGGPRHTANGDRENRHSCEKCRNPQVQRIDILIRTGKEPNDRDYPELPAIRGTACTFFDVKTFEDAWGRLKKWLKDVHGKQENEVLAMDLSAVLALLTTAAAEKLIPTIDLQNGILYVNGKVVSLGENEENVLKVLVNNPAITLQQFRRLSNVSEPQKVLKSLIKKYPELKPFITLPGKKGQGGYSTRIKAAA